MTLSRIIGLQSLIVVLLGAHACAQSDPSNFTTVLNVPDDAPSSQIDSNTQVNIHPDGVLSFFQEVIEAGREDGSSQNVEVNLLGGDIGSRLDANRNSTINLLSGSLDDTLNAYTGSQVNALGAHVDRIVALNGSQVNIASGNVNSLAVRQGGQLTVQGGLVHQLFYYEGSDTTISGGQVLNPGDLESGATLTVSGGVFGGGFFSSTDIDDNATAILDGGLFLTPLNVSGNVIVSGGAFEDFFSADSGSSVQVRGGEFHKNGQPILSSAPLGQTSKVFLHEGETISGVFANGTPFVFSADDGDSFYGPSSSQTNLRVLTLEVASVTAATPGELLASTSPNLVGIRDQQTLRVDAGSLVSPNFTAGRGSSVIVEQGAAIGDNFEAIGANVLIQGGHIGERFDVFSGAEVELQSGSIGPWAQVHGGRLTLAGGEVAETVEIFMGEIVVSGGTVGGLTLHENAFATIAGGSVTETVAGDGAVTLSGGSIGRVDLDNLDFEVRGDDFRIDGVPFLGLDSLGEQLVIRVPEGALLSGVLSDGTPFVFAASDGDDLSNRDLTLRVAETAGPGPATINLPTDLAPLGARSGQTVTVSQGGALPVNFVAGPGATVRIGDGATAGQNLEAIGALVEINGGAVGEGLDAFVGATIRLTAGTIGEDFEAHEGSTVELLGGVAEGSIEVEDATVLVANDAFVEQLYLTGDSSLAMQGGRVRYLTLTESSSATIAGGVIEDRTYVNQDSILTVTGGTFEDVVEVREGAAANFRGGVVQGNLTVDGAATLAGGAIGSSLSLGEGGDLTLEGDDFRVNGVPIGDLPENAVAAFVFSESTVLTGVFTDGVPFAFSRQDDDDVAGHVVRLKRTSIPDGPAMILLPFDSVPQGIREGQTLIAGDGAVIGDQFSAGFGSRVVVEVGATIGDNFEAAGARVEIDGGMVGDEFDAFHHSRVTVGSGVIGNGVDIHNGAELIVDGGTIGHSLQVLSGGRAVVRNGVVGEFAQVSDGGLMVVTGGEVGARLSIESGGVVSLIGGSIEQSVDIRNGGALILFGGDLQSQTPLFGADFDMDSGSTLIVAATHFELNGVDITDTLTPGVDIETTVRNQPLFVEFSDGSSSTLSLSTFGGTPGDSYHPSAKVLLRLVVSGDANADGVVDLDDFEAWQREFGTQAALPGNGADLNYDGLVNAVDYALWREAYDESLIAVANPEPATWLLAFVACVAAFTRKKPRA